MSFQEGKHPLVTHRTNEEEPFAGYWTYLRERMEEIPQSVERSHCDLNVVVTGDHGSQVIEIELLNFPKKKQYAMNDHVAHLQKIEAPHRRKERKPSSSKPSNKSCDLHVSRKPLLTVIPKAPTLTKFKTTKLKKTKPWWTPWSVSSNAPQGTVHTDSHHHTFRIFHQRNTSFKSSSNAPRLDYAALPSALPVEDAPSDELNSDPTTPTAPTTQSPSSSSSSSMSRRNLMKPSLYRPRSLLNHLSISGNQKSVRGGPEKSSSYKDMSIWYYSSPLQLQPMDSASQHIMHMVFFETPPIHEDPTEEEEKIDPPKRKRSTHRTKKNKSSSRDEKCSKESLVKVEETSWPNVRWGCCNSLMNNIYPSDESQGGGFDSIRRFQTYRTISERSTLE